MPRPTATTTPTLPPTADVPTSALPRAASATVLHYWFPPLATLPIPSSPPTALPKPELFATSAALSATTRLTALPTLELVSLSPPKVTLPAARLPALLEETLPR